MTTHRRLPRRLPKDGGPRRILKTQLEQQNSYVVVKYGVRRSSNRPARLPSVPKACFPKILPRPRFYAGQSQSPDKPDRTIGQTPSQKPPESNTEICPLQATSLAYSHSRLTSDAEMNNYDAIRPKCGGRPGSAVQYVKPRSRTFRKRYFVYKQTSFSVYDEAR